MSEPAKSNQPTSTPQPKQSVYIKPPRDLAAGSLRTSLESFDPRLPHKLSTNSSK